MTQPTAPADLAGTKTGFGIYLDGADDAPAWVRIVDAAVVADETTKSGAMAIASKVLHDAADPAAEGPIKFGGYAKAAAPTDVSADGDRVNAWFLRNGAQAVNLTATGALIPGDATDGLKVQISGAALTALQLIDDPVQADDGNGFTIGTSKVMMAGAVVDDAATDAGDEGDAVAVRATPDRKLVMNPQPHTVGGLSTFNASGSDGADTTALVATAVAVKASAGQLYGWWIYNPNDEVSYVNFYNIAQGSVTVGSSTVKKQLAIPAGAAANVALTHGIAFDTAITVSATKTEGTNTAPDVGLSVQLDFK